ncbi:MAG TPA: hypothetical protein VE134_08445 [Methanomicrobiales archaeon]|nr:hypothetical protein [Methanomicrobiales archaeon]
MSVYDIHVNQRGINSIEAPKQMEVEVGRDLEVRLVNHGHPIHLTLSALNPRAFTDFIHENLYIDDEIEYRVPIRQNAKAGSFDMEVIAGYGSKRTKFSVNVVPAVVKEEKPPEPEPTPPLFSLPQGIKEPAAVMAAVSIVAYALWFLAFQQSFEGVLLNVFAFLMLLFSFAALWSRRTH